jgi:hypothetical protein
MTITVAAQRTAESARDTIISLLKSDRERLMQSFPRFCMLDPAADCEACEWLVRKTCAELEIVSTLKQELLYPCAGHALADQGLIDQAAIEWQTVSRFLHQLEQMTPRDTSFAATFIVLGEYIQQQANQEDRRLLPRLAGAPVDWENLRPEWLARRADLQAELAPWAPFADESTPRASSSIT